MSSVYKHYLQILLVGITYATIVQMRVEKDDQASETPETLETSKTINRCRAKYTTVLTAVTAAYA